MKNYCMEGIQPKDELIRVNNFLFQKNKLLEINQSPSPPNVFHLCPAIFIAKTGNLVHRARVACLFYIFCKVKFITNSEICFRGWFPRLTVIWRVLRTWLILFILSTYLWEHLPSWVHGYFLCVSSCDMRNLIFMPWILLYLLRAVHSRSMRGSSVGIWAPWWSHRSSHFYALAKISKSQHIIDLIKWNALGRLIFIFRKYFGYFGLLSIPEPCRSIS